MWWSQSYKLPHLKVMHIGSKTVSTAYEPWLAVIMVVHFT